MRRLFHIKYGFQKGSHKIKNNYKNKKYTIHKDIKNLKYVKTIKMYNILTQIHLNYKFKKITFKNIQIHGLSDCLAKGVKILDGMKCSPLLAPIPLDTWKSEIQLSSGIIIMLFLLSYENHIMLNKSI